MTTLNLATSPTRFHHGVILLWFPRKTDSNRPAESSPHVVTPLLAIECPSGIPATKPSRSHEPAAQTVHPGASIPNPSKGIANQHAMVGGALIAPRRGRSGNGESPLRADRLVGLRGDPCPDTQGVVRRPQSPNHLPCSASSVRPGLGRSARLWGRAPHEGHQPAIGTCLAEGISVTRLHSGRAFPLYIFSLVLCGCVRRARFLDPPNGFDHRGCSNHPTGPNSQPTAGLIPAAYDGSLVNMSRRAPSSRPLGIFPFPELMFKVSIVSLRPLRILFTAKNPNFVWL